MNYWSGSRSTNGDHPVLRHRTARKPIGRRVGIIALVGALLAGSATPAFASRQNPRPGEGWISLQTRTCGNSAGWQQSAKANGSSAPRWILPLRTVNVTCPGVHEPKTPAKTKATKWLRPVPNTYCSSGFGPRWGSFHDGVDIVAPKGTPIKSPAAGVVEFAGWDAGKNSGGWYVRIRNSGGWKTWLFHMKQRPSVKAGQPVARGQVVGYVGNTGFVVGKGGGYHVHLRLHHNGQRVNPAPLVGVKC